MVCPNCGNQLKENLRFCTKCGTPQQVSTQNVQDQAPQRFKHPISPTGALQHQQAKAQDTSSPTHHDVPKKPPINKSPILFIVLFGVIALSISLVILRLKHGNSGPVMKYQESGKTSLKATEKGIPNNAVKGNINIRSIDFDNIEFTDDEGNVSKFRNGKCTIPGDNPELESDNYQQEIKLLGFGDLLGDGTEQALMRIEHSVGNSSYFTFHVIGINNAKIKLLYTISEPNGKSAEIVGNKILLTAMYLADNDARCCPSIKKILTYAWNGSSFTRVMNNKKYKLTECTKSDYSTVPNEVKVKLLSVYEDGDPVQEWGEPGVYLIDLNQDGVDEFVLQFIEAETSSHYIFEKMKRGWTLIGRFPAEDVFFGSSSTAGYMDITGTQWSADAGPAPDLKAVWDGNRYKVVQGYE